MKKLFFICLGIVLVNASIAQNTLDYIGLTSSTPAASAYSLRKLSSTYASNAIQVRRSSDNTTQDIGFAGNNLDTASLKTFVGAGNGFVTIWYDQSGNGRNLTQTTTSKQPAIVNAGVIYRRNFKPTTYYDASDDGMLYAGSDYLTSNPMSVNIVAGSNSSNAGARRAVQGTTNWLIGPYTNQHSWYANGWNHQISTPWSLTLAEIFTVIQPSSGSCTSWRNGVSQTTSNNNGSPNKMQTGTEGSYAEILDGYISEVLAFNSALGTTDRQNLEANQTTYYSSVALSTDATLSALTTTAGTLTPTFASATIAYSASVTNATTSVTVTPTKTDANATIQVQVNSGGYATVTSGTASSALSLNVGSNTIDVLVTAQDGITTKTYTITVTRSAADNALNFDGTDDYVSVTDNAIFNTATYTAEAWVKLTATSGTYQCIFGRRTSSLGWNFYSDNANKWSLWNGYSEVISGPSTTFGQWMHVAVTGSASGQKMYINGVQVGSTSNVVSPASGQNFMIGRVSESSSWFAKGNINEVRFWNVERTATEISTNMNTTVSPSATGLIAYYRFDQGTAGGNNAGLTTLTDLTSNALNGTLNNFALTGNTSNWVGYPGSSNANLSALTTTSGTISPTFASTTTAYTATVAYATTSVTVTPTMADATATIQVRVNSGSYATVTSGSASAALSLNVGSNTIDVKVTAEDGFTIKTYTITVTRSANLIASGGNITYTGSYTIHSFIAAGAASFNPPVTGNIEVLVVAGGGSGGGTSGPTSGGHYLGGGGGAGGLSSSTTYAVTAGSSVAVTVGAGGTSVTLGNGNNGSNSVFGTITTTGGGGGGKYGVAGLSGGSGGGSGRDAGPGGTGTAGQGNNGGTGDSGGGGGAGAAGSGINGGNGLSSSITGTATYYAGGGGGTGTGNPGGTGGLGGGGDGKNSYNFPSLVAVSGTPNTGGGGGGAGVGNATGAGGSGVVIVKYLTGSTTTSVDASGLTISSGSISPSFNTNTMAYTTASVPNATTSVTVTPNVVDVTNTIQVRVNGGSYATVTNGSASGALSLTVGSNTIDTKVSAADGTTKIYTITLTRAAAATDATLSALTTTAGTIAPTFASATIAYTASVPNATTSVTVTPTKNDANATIQVRVNSGSYTTVTSGSPSGALSLNVGSNTIDVLVTAQDGTTTKTYTITVTRTMQPPGNALTFNGTNQRVDINATLGNFGTSNFTIEAWVKTAAASGSVLSKRTVCTNGNFFDLNMITGGKLYFELNQSNGSDYTSITSTTSINDSKWHHIAVARNGTSLSMYVDGISNATPVTIIGSPNINNVANFIVGASTTCNNYFNGNIDEVRVYNAALTQPNIAADMLSTSSSLPGNLQAYYNFDAVSGTALNDQASTNNGTLFNTPSWVESYAMVVPTAVAATSLTTTGFTANWTAPAIGTVDNGYRLDVSTSSSFASFVTGYNGLTVAGTSQAVTSLSAGTTYYYRIRADKTSVTGQGGNSLVTAAVTISTDATLSALTTTAGTISPTFAAATTAYTASVANATTSVTITPTKNDANATIQVRVNSGSYATVASGTASSALSLNVGSNTIDVKVTAQDGTTIKTYTITVTRASFNTLDYAGLSSSTPSKVAYSLRLLSSTYTGPLVRITVGSNYYDVYPDASANKTVSLSSPISASYSTYNAAATGATASLLSSIISGSVSSTAAILYDQSGYANDAFQSVTAKQPGIITSGSVNLQNGKPTLLFSNTPYFNTNYTGLDITSGSGTITTFNSVHKCATQDASIISNNAATSRYNIHAPEVTGNTTFDLGSGAGSRMTSPLAWTTFSVGTFRIGGSQGDVWQNGVNKISVSSFASSVTSSNTMLIGSFNTTGGYYFNGPISEITIFTTALSTTDRQTLEANQQLYYSTPSSNANLSALTLSAGTLSPTFAAATITYTASVTNATTSLTVTPTSADGTATIQVRINGGSYGTVTSGSTSAPLSLNAGSNTIDVTVTSSNGATIKTYTITVTRSANSTITSFSDISKIYYDVPFALTAPTSNSTGAFTYTSSNTAVATISGSTVTILAAGTSTITATQAADATYASNSIAATLTVSSVTVVTKNGQVTSTNPNYVSSKGAINNSTGVNKNGQSITTKSNTGDGLSAANASTSAYAIKQAYPSSTDGLYWIANPNINSGTPFQIYADMTTDGGGWTLILCNSNVNGWNYANAISLNTASPSISTNYSIVGWADYIKKSASGFQYMIDATTRRSNGAIWTANGAYSFVNSNNTQTNITINTKFGTWTYNDGGIEQTMPWYSNCGGAGILTTSSNCGGNYWVPLVSTGFSPAPWINSGCGVEGCAANPGIIWYWVR